MVLSDYEWNTFVRGVCGSPDAKTAKGMFEVWLGEKCSEVYKQGWKDACKEYDVEDAMDWYGEESDGYDLVPNADYGEF